MDVLHTLIAIAVAILLIIRFGIDPVISLIISSIYLGLATGVGLVALLLLVGGLLGLYAAFQFAGGGSVSLPFSSSKGG